MPKRRPLSLALLLLVAAVPGFAGDLCSDILQGGVFEKYDSVDERLLISQAQRIYCSSSYSKSDSETTLGLDIGLIVEGVPIDLGMDFGQRDTEEWRSEACKYDWSSLKNWSSRKTSIAKASDSIVKAWSQCMASAKDGVVTGVSFSSPTDFVLTVQINGLDKVPALKYESSGIRIAPADAAQFADGNEFRTVSRTSSRRHSFRMKRADPARGFELLVDSKPVSSRLTVPAANFPVTPAPPPPPKTTYLNKRTPVRIDGVYSTTQCGRSTNGFVFANGKTYTNSLYMHPGPRGFTHVEFRVPFGAKRLVLEGVGLCQDSGSPECNGGFPLGGWAILADGAKLASGEVGWPHSDARSVDVRTLSFDVSGADTVHFEASDRGNSGWCDHVTFLNPRFEP